MTLIMLLFFLGQENDSISLPKLGCCGCRQKARARDPLHLTLCDLMGCSPPGCLSMGFSRQEYWSGLTFPPLGDLPNPGIKPRTMLCLLHCQADSLPLSHLGSPAGGVVGPFVHLLYG